MNLKKLNHAELVKLFISVQGKDKELVKECFTELLNRTNVGTPKEKRGEKRNKGNTAKLLRKIKLNDNN